MPAFYERYWSGREGHLNDFQLKWPRLSPLIPRERNIAIMDLGCGQGSILRELQQLNPAATYVGLDVSEKALAVARKQLPDMRFEAITDGGRFPAQDSSIDFIFSSEVIEHIYDTGNAFAEMARVLKPGGRVLLTTPYHGFVKNLVVVLTSFDDHFDPMGPHVRFFSRRTLDRALRKNSILPVQWGHYGRFYPLQHSIFVLGRRAS